MADFNPYAPPSATTDIDPGTGDPLFTDSQVALATFFGSPIAGFIVLAINERRMGRGDQIAKMIGLGVVASAFVIGLALVLPSEMPGFIVTLGYVFGMREGARRWQGEEIMARLSNGTPKGSYWAMVGIGLACVIPLALVFAAIFFVDPSLMPK